MASETLANRLERARLSATRDVFSPEDYWESLEFLAEEDSPGAYPLVSAWTRDADPRLRKLAVDGLRLLNRVAAGRRAFRDQTIDVYKGMLASETDPDVIAAIGFANCDLSDPRMAEILLPFRSHPDGVVRQSVVHALANARDPRSVAAMVALSSDENDEVRNWATFQLANLDAEDSSPLDSPEIRDALRARTSDNMDEVRAEAVLGLARRRDARAVPLVAAQLEGEGPDWSQYVEAASVLGDRTLLPALERLKAQGWGSGKSWLESVLNEAIESLRGHAPVRLLLS